jgi:regulator of PEP synthase PpsR (kinase-PPPase family)
LQRAIEHIRQDPGLVFFTLVNPELRKELETQCVSISVPCLDVLDGPVAKMRQFLGAAETHRPGGQHEVDQRYLQRIEALNFSIQHDDGQALDTIGEAEIVLVGASRTSKTPTCVYLAIRGVRAANVPLVPGMALPDILSKITKPLIVGLWASPDRLVQVRRNRLTTLGEVRDTEYVDLEAVRAEIATTRKLFEQHDWPAIDVSRRSIEETAAAVLNLLTERQEAQS